MEYTDVIIMFLGICAINVLIVIFCGILEIIIGWWMK